MTNIVPYTMELQKILSHLSKKDQAHLTLRADNSVVSGFEMGDRCSFFLMALIGLILRNTFARSFSCCRIQGVLGVTQISHCL